MYGKDTDVAEKLYRVPTEVMFNDGFQWGTRFEGPLAAEFTLPTSKKKKKKTHTHTHIQTCVSNLV